MRFDTNWSRLASIGTGRPFRSPAATTPAVEPIRIVTDLGGSDFSWGRSNPLELDRLNQSLEADPTDFYSVVRRGRVHRDKGRYDPAIADYTRALALRPRDPGSLGGRGEAYLKKKQFTSGFADCEASLAVLPDQALLQNNLAWAYATAPPAVRNPAKALVHARKAVQLAPDIGNHHNTLGVALFRMGQFRESVVELEKSLAKAAPGYEPFDLFFLAMCHVRLGDTKLAKVEYERACRLQAAARHSTVETEELRSIRLEAEDLLGDVPVTPVQVGDRDCTQSGLTCCK